MRGALFIVTLLLAACASDQRGIIGGGPADAPKEIVKRGVVESVTPIELDASSNAGANVGGVFGQVGGAGTGGGRGSTVGIILGGVVGGTLGQQAGIATKPGLEIWVKLDGEEDKSTFVMQPGQPDAFKVGDRVRVVSKKGETRVELETVPDKPKGKPPEDKPKEPLPL